ncbi:hypothetical protein GCM10012287_03950 [Streptomyces daqingensis]|uniref:Glycosyl hydrolase family 32 n=1 Tax=Streptomyces daqingensis TaxID=1472640 RepID=A0ABQ2LTT0_9ACTN|nr:hypothetical protein [Streptomyces daqingensis]GGO42627.1 hypothetical protein GCM10012287_03950 [Streptomyces daqingensis]
MDTCTDPAGQSGHTAPGSGSGTGAFPLPGTTAATVAVPAPGSGPQRWAGAPSALYDADGSLLLAYRVRDAGEDRNVVARTFDGSTYTAVAVLESGRLDAMMVERPALVRTPAGTLRLYVSCATPGTKHWWVGVLEAPTAEELPGAVLRPVFRGDHATAVKDPVIRCRDGRWEAWLCCHPLDRPGHEDRMFTAYATSEDGLEWRWRGPVLRGRPGAWDARGARLTSVLPDGRASYDGRARAEENWFERTGLAAGEVVDGAPQFSALGREPVADVRYLEVLPLPGAAGHRIFYEARLRDGSHELRTELILPEEWSRQRWCSSSCSSGTSSERSRRVPSRRDSRGGSVRAAGSLRG